jgi:hypothetical protein
MFLEGYLKNPEVYDTANSTMRNYKAQPDLGVYAAQPLMEGEQPGMGPEVPDSMKMEIMRRTQPGAYENLMRLKARYGARQA